MFTRFPRRWALLAATAAVPAAAPAADAPRILPPIDAAKVAPAPPAEADKRVVAYVQADNQATPVYRDELGAFLIARGGADKLDLLVNKRIIDGEAARRGITVTPEEVQAAVNDDLAGLNVKPKEFVELILPRYGNGKTLYEWTEDVIRPRVLLGKMVRDGVSVSEDELRRAHERLYGEKRQARIIVWPSEPAQAVKDAVRTDDAAFDRAAGQSPDPKLAQAGGRVNPVGRHPDAKDRAAVDRLFALKVGETSDVFPTADGSWMCVRCTGVVPPSAAHPFEKVRPQLEREEIDRKVSEAVPPFFADLKKRAGITMRADARQPGPAGEPLATINGTENVTREDLGEFLIARGGAARLEFLVNKKIIEFEAARRNLAVTPAEVDAAFVTLIKVLGDKVTKADFVREILPKYKKTEFEYVEDVVKPEVVLGKMVADRVKVTDDDLRKAFERRFGEKRACAIIIWPAGQQQAALKQWDAVRKNEDEFDRAARTQADPNLAAAAGRVAPIGRHLKADDPIVEKVAFGLQPGEVSHLFQTRAGTMCIKCLAKVDPVAGVSFDAVRAGLEAEERQEATAREIPKLFAELKEKANPTFLLQPPPRPGEFEDAVKTLVNERVRPAAATTKP